MPFKDRRFEMRFQLPQAVCEEIRRAVVEAALLALDTIITGQGGILEIISRDSEVTVFRVSRHITSLMIRRRLSSMGLKPEITMVTDPK